MGYRGLTRKRDSIKTRLVVWRFKMNKNIVKTMIALAIGMVLAVRSFAQDKVAPAPEKVPSQAAQDKDAKALRLERKRAIEAAKAAKAKAKSQEKQRAAKAAAEAKSLDLNRASKAELKKLPGITDALADAVIAHRPYRSKADLVNKSVLPMGVYQGLHDQVAAKYISSK